MTLINRMQATLVSASRRYPGRYAASWALVGAVCASIAWSMAIDAAPPGGISQSQWPASATIPGQLAADTEPTQLSSVPREALHTTFLGGESTNCDAGVIGRVSFNAPLDPSHCKLHERASYTVEPPDVLLVHVTAEFGDEALLEEINREHLVSADGMLDLADRLDPLPVAGKTVAEIRAAVEEQLGPHFQNPSAAVSVFAANSRVYYVILQNGDGAGDMVYRLPATGNETVLDAIASVNKDVNDLSAIARKRIWVARPSETAGVDTILQVDWKELAGGVTRSNHALLPGDRLFICGDAPRRETAEACCDEAGECDCDDTGADD